MNEIFKEFDRNLLSYEIYMNRITMESLNMELDICGTDSYFESASILYEGSVGIKESVKKGFNKLKEMIKTLVNKLREYISTKIKMVKMKIQFNNLRKAIKAAGAENSKNPNASLYNSSADYTKDYVSYVEKYTKIAKDSFKSSDSIDEANQKLSEGKEALDKEYEKFLSCGPTNIYHTVAKDAVVIGEEDLTKLNKMLDIVQNISDEKISELEKLADSETDVEEVTENTLFEEDSPVVDKIKSKARNISLSSVLRTAAGNIAKLAQATLNVISKYGITLALIFDKNFAAWFDPVRYRKVQAKMNEYTSPNSLKKDFEKEKERKLSKENFA